MEGTIVRSSQARLRKANKQPSIVKPKLAATNRFVAGSLVQELQYPILTRNTENQYRFVATANRQNAI
jgi:purine nucleoside permease